MRITVLSVIIMRENGKVLTKLSIDGVEEEFVISIDTYMPEIGDAIQVIHGGEYFGEKFRLNQDLQAKIYKIISLIYNRKPHQLPVTLDS